MPGGVVEVVLDGHPALVSDAELTAWVATAARAIAAYYGTFPVPRATVTVHGGGAGRISSGRTVGVRGTGRIAIGVGNAATPADLKTNWELVHEMVHLAFPSMNDAPWLEEGLATYVEPIVRARSGLAPGADVWKWLVWGLPRGEQALAGAGLDRARSWAATYWGGALFCFDADVAIREKTGGKRSLDDALRAIVREGGNVTVTWPLERALVVGDRATGTTVLRDVYARMRDRPPREDLAAVFARLGVEGEGGESGAVTFDDKAPLAWIRKGITTGK
ncbi:MAG TPA: hypothetical protein VFA98_05695 [Thermoanaerobaculia bacterium]|nr:hypothetical protein [Thermoanaerobaculia bacterium]